VIPGEGVRGREARIPGHCGGERLVLAADEAQHADGPGLLQHRNVGLWGESFKYGGTVHLYMFCGKNCYPTRQNGLNDKKQKLSTRVRG
jgi:hypothetical protein